MSRARITSSKRMSNRAYHAGGKPTWWARVGTGDEASWIDEVSAAKTRGDEELDVTIADLSDEIIQVTVGVGNTKDGVREVVKVEREIPHLLFCDAPLAPERVAKGWTEVHGWLWDTTLCPRPTEPRVYRRVTFVSNAEAAANNDKSVRYYSEEEDSERDEGREARLYGARAEVARLEAALAEARARVASIEQEPQS